MTESEIRRRNQETGYFLSRRIRRCLKCGIVSVTVAFLWLPVLFLFVIWGVSMWGYAEPQPIWYQSLLLLFTIMPSILSFGIFLYVLFGLLLQRESWTGMEKTGLFLSVIAVVFYLIVWAIIMNYG